MCYNVSQHRAWGGGVHGVDEEWEQISGRSKNIFDSHVAAPHPKTKCSHINFAEQENL